MTSVVVNIHGIEVIVDGTSYSQPPVSDNTVEGAIVKLAKGITTTIITHQFEHQVPTEQETASRVEALQAAKLEDPVKAEGVDPDERYKGHETQTTSAEETK